MDVVQLLLHITLFLWCVSINTATVAAAPQQILIAKPNCPSHCGNISIPYPFGIGPGCYADNWFEILCNESVSPPKPFLNRTTLNLEVLEISIAGTLKVRNPITVSNNCSDKPIRQAAYLWGSPFVFSQKNRFTVVGCGVMAGLNSSSDGLTISATCLSQCEIASNASTTCNGGLDCSQVSIPSFLSTFDTSFISTTNPCNYAFLADQDWFQSFTNNLTNISARISDMDYVPAVLEWGLYHSILDVFGTSSIASDRSVNCLEYNDTSSTNSSSRLECFCATGFEGNPYLIEGCQDINECLAPNRQCPVDYACKNHPGYAECYYPKRKSAVKLAFIVIGSVLGLLFLLGVAWWLHKAIKKRKNIKQKEKFFKQNGGLLLEQQLLSGEVNVDKIKLFNSKELDKATDHFNVDRILGQGGQGTVYKGMLEDGRIVAVKQSKKLVGGEVGNFINEIVILSQINHRNVVKLLGCCLETEVPLLVYEFILNGTLSQYIHHHNEEFPLTWEMRLRVSKEIAGAISYLHSSASMPIYHRDIKSSNILLDDKYRAKVADFGTSRSIAIDKTHLTTRVQGTFGYLDPEYFQSSQFTDKSDVYSFGVVLAELLTGQKPISPTTSDEWRSLANHFILSMEGNCLFDILDTRVRSDGREEEIVAVANLAKRCLNLNGRKRPTMKEVAVELEGIQLSVKAHSDAQQNFSEIGYDRTNGMTEAWDVRSTSTGLSCMDGTTGSSLDAQPLLSF
ncbi:wall-associated receptor kinase-like 10 isoform X1 [Rosa rugosa]|uniref:wall-associated receptor kinase-like 10 isoform X1 n=2 Tax=Rosa rugosa TaxID=74645 RepID=UPI002B4111DA|nr:wall-associated receptor kinase-like 10 isoform X1 [Rosa rugosa]